MKLFICLLLFSTINASFSKLKIGLPPFSYKHFSELMDKNKEQTKCYQSLDYKFCKYMLYHKYAVIMNKLKNPDDLLHFIKNHDL